MVIIRGLGVLLGVAGALTLASGQATSPAIKVRTIAEVETRVTEGGREVVHLVTADRVVPGDQVLYTLEIKNAGPIAVLAPSVVNAVPAHVIYLANSATGPGADVTYSVDGGRSFERAENLRVRGTDGRPRKAKAMDYTHIRWQLKNTLKSNSVAYARFRAIVK